MMKTSGTFVFKLVPDQTGKNTTIDKNSARVVRFAEIEKVNNKLNNWFSLDYKEFIKELKKNNVKLSLSEESELIQYFNEQKAKAIQIENEIKKVDKQIDQMVYKLYDLTEEEIKIVEENV